MTNQASEDEPTKSKVDWSTPYDEWLIPTLNRFRYGGAIECRAIPSQIQLNIESLIRNEKLKLLAEVRELLIDRIPVYDGDDSFGKEYQAGYNSMAHATRTMQLQQSAELTKLEAEL